MKVTECRPNFAVLCFKKLKSATCSLYLQRILTIEIQMLPDNVIGGGGGGGGGGDGE